MSDDYEIAKALTNYRRSFLAIGEAFIAASGRLSDWQNEHVDVVRSLERELVARDGTIDMLALDTALTCFIGLEAAKAGIDPRDLIDRHFKAAPTQDQWNRMMADARTRRREGAEP